MSKPSILIVPGSFAHPSLYDNLVEALAKHGYELRALHIPSIGLEAGVGRDIPPPSMYDDAAFIAQEVNKLADEGKDVVLIPHSYGGVPATESVDKSLTKEAREKDGKKGGLVRLAYMTCLVPAVGQTAKDVLDELPPGDAIPMNVDENGWMYHVDFEITAAKSFSDIPKEEGLSYVKRFAKHSSVSFMTPLRNAGYKNIPISYLLCEDDITIPADLQRKGIEHIEKESGNKVDVTSIKAGHCPSADSSAPHLVVDWILAVASK
ncbi:Alpha/beta hydrolase fold-1 [Xylariales sp. PMI_506]|nr:Alpha/beta hydrolase fold-1 [Xylariales sp. PMI_506]